jgi:hypothetical protein
VQHLSERHSERFWEQCARAFDERVHPAVDAASGGTRPAQEPTVQRLDVVEVRGAAVDGILT